MNFQDIEIFYNDSFHEYLAIDRKGVVVCKATDKKLFWKKLNKKIGFAVICTGYRDNNILNTQILEGI